MQGGAGEKMQTNTQVNIHFGIQIRTLYTVYILELQGGKYYVGKSKNPTKRIQEHFESKGSGWTKIHKPLRVVELIPERGPYDEDAYAIELMSKHENGIDSVRGGSFCEINLSEASILTIKKMIKSANDECFRCGQRWHFINECQGLSHSDVQYIKKDVLDVVQRIIFLMNVKIQKIQ